MTSNGFADKDYFRTTAKRRFKDVPRPDGQKVRIRSLSAGEHAALDMKQIDPKTGKFRAAGMRDSDLNLFIACVCDGDGQQIFSDSDIDEIRTFDSAAIVPIVKEIREHCGLKNTVEDSLKNSDTTTGGGSPTSSAGVTPEQPSTAST